MGTFNLSITERQKKFIDSDADEVLYGGAAGGGKSFGQVIDAFIKAYEYPYIKQLVLRTSFPELERSLILTALEIIPKSCYTYNASKHKMVFSNGSLIEFGYLSSDSAVTQYQSAEYDIIRFDELTHFSEYQYLYMLSRLRGANSFPKQIKSSTNPGSIGHAWVKERFIDKAVFDEKIIFDDRTRVFIPAKVTDNCFLMKYDPDYIKRLDSLPENERKALLDGCWDIFEGQFFTEFDREKHVILPFEIPKGYKRFCALDYGLDTTCCLWFAVDSVGVVFVYREYYEKDKTLSEAAKEISKICSDEHISYIASSPDLWNRRQDTGFSGVEIMAGANLFALVRADDRRIAGWRVLREYLKGNNTLKIFCNCKNLIRTLPALTHDKYDVGDASDSPHEITHAPEALRYGLMSRPPTTVLQNDVKGFYTKTEREDYIFSKNKIRRRC